MTNSADLPAPPSVADTLCGDSAACRDAVAELFQFLDGELTKVRKATIGQHLDDCSDCLEAFDFHVELRMVISQKCRTELPEGLKDRVFSALRALDE